MLTTPKAISLASQALQFHFKAKLSYNSIKLDKAKVWHISKREETS